MKRLLTGVVLAFISLTMIAQNNTQTQSALGAETRTDGFERQIPVPFTNSHLYKKQLVQNQVAQQGGQRMLTTTPLGTAGNLFTIINGEVKSICTNNELNTVAFIHRTNPQDTIPFPNENVGMYRFDVSYNGGATWELNSSVLNPSASQDTLAGRFPQCAIYNPAANTDPDSASLVYLGPWLPFDLNGTWEGIFYGAAELSRDSTTFTQNFETPNGGDVLIPGGLCNGEPGVFWAVDWSATELPDETFDYNGILVYKGVWNDTTNDVDFELDTQIPVAFDKSDDGTSQAAAISIAFDPTGQEGWIGFVGDIDASFNNTQYFDVHFYNTTDAGTTWNGPISLELDEFDDLAARLTQGLPASTGFEADMAVDVNGNPHFAVLVGSGGAGQNYAITTGGTDPGLAMYDFTRITDDTSLDCQWQAIALDTVFTMRGDITQGADAVSSDNRPQVATSPNGEKVFISWLDSDPNLSGGSNEIPDIHMRAIDVTSGLATPSRNWTKGEPIEASAVFGTMARTSLESGGTYSLPYVIAQPNISGDAGDPAGFLYVDGISYTDADFVDQIFSGLVPDITVLGDNPAFVYLGDTYIDAGATALDCREGDVTASIMATDNINTTARGIYQVSYSAENSAGFTGTADRDVIVNTEPDADFSFSIAVEGLNRRVQFTDESLYSPTDWEWTFDNGFGAGTANPSFLFTANGVYNVCLTATNVYNDAPFSQTPSTTCKDVEIVGVSINENVLDGVVSVFPNPSNGIIKVQLDGMLLNNAVVSVHNMLGAEVALENLGTVNASTSLSINLSEMGAGIYFVKVSADEGTTTKRITVQ